MGDGAHFIQIPQGASPKAHMVRISTSEIQDAIEDIGWDGAKRSIARFRPAVVMSEVGDLV